MLAWLFVDVIAAGVRLCVEIGVVMYNPPAVRPSLLLMQVARCVQYIIFYNCVIDVPLLLQHRKLLMAGPPTSPNRPQQEHHVQQLHVAAVQQEQEAL